MICEPLPNTGVDAHIGLLLTIGIACLIIGIALLIVVKSRGKGTTATLTILLAIGAALALNPGTPVQASSSDCVSGDNSLTIVQTAVIDDLAPGVAPVPITGLVTNNGTDSTYITVVAVEITSVTTEMGAGPGTCDASDYQLRHPSMPVERTLKPGGSATFTGALIGFNNKSINQDACQRATIHLQYTANPD